MDSVLGVVVLTLLGVDGVISAVLGAIFLQIRIGSVPFPVSAVLSGVANSLLVWAGLQWASSLRLAALPLWTFLFTLAAMAFIGGPGGDAVLAPSTAPALDQLNSLLLLVLGTAPAAVVLWRRRQARGLR